MDEKIFQLLEKMHSENQQQFAEIRQDISGMKQDISGMKQDISGMRQDMARMEHTLSSKIDALFDGYKANTEAIAELKDKVTNHEIKLSVVR